MIYVVYSLLSWFIEITLVIYLRDNELFERQNSVRKIVKSFLSFGIRL